MSDFLAGEGERPSLVITTKFEGRGVVERALDQELAHLGPDSSLTVSHNLPGHKFPCLKKECLQKSTCDLCLSALHVAQSRQSQLLTPSLCVCNLLFLPELSDTVREGCHCPPDHPRTNSLEITHPPHVHPFLSTFPNLLLSHSVCHMWEERRHSISRLDP